MTLVIIKFNFFSKTKIASQESEQLECSRVDDWYVARWTFREKRR